MFFHAEKLFAINPVLFPLFNSLIDLSCMRGLLIFSMNCWLTIGAKKGTYPILFNLTVVFESAEYYGENNSLKFSLIERLSKITKLLPVELFKEYLVDVCP
jgi:hypothetical protein